MKMKTSRARSIVGVTLGLGLAIVLGGCASPRDAVSSSGGPQTPSLNPIPVKTPEPAFADRSGGLLVPAPAGITFSLNADQVRALLARDGASAQWVADSDTLIVKSGVYDALPLSASTKSASRSAVGVPSYVFSGNVGPCPPAAPGGAGTPKMTGPASSTCTGTVVADGSTGEIEDVEVAPFTS